MEYSEEIRCPNCNSNQLTANQKGFSAGKAIGGALLTGGVGLLAGFIGSKKVLITCLKCGRNFKVGEGRIDDGPGEFYGSFEKHPSGKAKAIVGEVKRPLSTVEEINNATIVWSEEQLIARNKKELTPEELEIRNKQALEQEERQKEAEIRREQRLVQEKKERRNIRVVLSVVVVFIALISLVHFSSDFSDPYVSNFGQLYFWIVICVLSVAGFVLKIIWDLTK